ncbi:uncharacterized protein LOC122316314 [Carya illinoinensis]|uniref:uncharacterized protein LOC122316314 n=1 Tax=Carya illinoinensis TaxID=32201 RepID=UPI001C71AFD0|nr:uncharacterized protein LOC122316314 [Carya illinoinensis]
MDRAITTYSIDDEVKVEDFIKEVSYTVLFNEAECVAKCVAKCLYSYDVAYQKSETVRYKRLLKICYEVITNAASYDGHTEDMISKLSAAVSRIRAKILYVTSKERFRRELDGIHYEMQVTDPT